MLKVVAGVTLPVNPRPDPETKIHSRISRLVISVLVAQRLGRRTFDQAVAGSTPGRGVIKSPRSTRPSIHQG